MINIFDRTEIVAEMRAERLIAVLQSYVPKEQVTDDLIWSKIQAATKDMETRLRVFLEPVDMLPPSVEQDEKDVLTAAGTRWEDETGTDWDPDMFKGDKWGYFVTRHRPIISVASIKFIYPVSNQQIWTIPDNWIKLDKRYGHVRLVPSGTPFYAPLNSYMMSVAGGGKNIPDLVHIRYVSGLVDVHNDYPDIIDLIKRMAVLRIIDDAFVPQSGSIGADGLTESFGIDFQKNRDQITEDIKTIKQELHGIPLMAV